MDSCKKTFIDKNSLYKTKFFILKDTPQYNWNIENNGNLIPANVGSIIVREKTLIMSLKYDNKKYKNIFLAGARIIVLPNLFLDEFIADWSEYNGK
jgi:hypothetical protein